ncbi:hypothetical protein YQE_08458, partial [Dendroctonus ponderosae]
MAGAMLFETSQSVRSQQEKLLNAKRTPEQEEDEERAIQNKEQDILNLGERYSKGAGRSDQANAALPERDQQGEGRQAGAIARRLLPRPGGGHRHRGAAVQRVHRMGQRGEAHLLAPVAGGAPGGPLLRHRHVRGGAAARLHAAQGAEEAGRQEPAGRGAAAGEQNLPRAEQPAQSQGGADLGPHHRQRNLLPPEGAGVPRPAVGHPARRRRKGLQDRLLVLLRGVRGLRQCGGAARPHRPQVHAAEQDHAEQSGGRASDRERQAGDQVCGPRHRGHEGGGAGLAQALAGRLPAGGQAVQARAGGRRDCARPSGHPLRQHARAEPLQDHRALQSRRGRPHRHQHQAADAPSGEETLPDDFGREVPRDPGSGRRCSGGVRGDGRGQDLRDGAGDDPEHEQGGGHALPKGQKAVLSPQ